MATVIPLHDARTAGPADAQALARAVSEAMAAPDSAAGPVADTRGRALHDLRISVTDRCNFRCVYCMPKDVFGRDYPFLPHSALLTFEEIVRIARIFVGHGVRKIRLTGGEPLLRKNVERLIEMLAPSGRHRPHAHHERRVARAQGREPARCRPEARHREPRLARRCHVPRR